jgi:transcription initiation factor TFIIIB Brf1 subunit/transcription initiation factor TFIIB
VEAEVSHLQLEVAMVAQVAVVTVANHHKELVMVLVELELLV